VNILLDTNVLISAFIAHGTCHEVFEHVAVEHCLVTSDYILDEFAAKMCAKFGYTRREAAEARDLIRGKAYLVSPVAVALRRKVDPDDLAVLGTAIAGECDCMVTGDKGLLRLTSIAGIPILAPHEFWRWETRRD
jgi:uncharacterized protein